MTAPIRTVGSNNWRYRTGYQHRQRVPMPILPMTAPRLGLLQRILGK